MDRRHGFEAAEDLVLQDFGIHWFDFCKASRRPSDHDPRDGNAVAGQTVRPPSSPGLRHLSRRPGLARLRRRHSPRRAGYDGLIGTRGTIASAGPDLGRQTVELHTEAGVARPVLHGTWFK